MVRKTYKFHTVYKILNNITQQYYIGKHSTDNLNDSYFGSGGKLYKNVIEFKKENFSKYILKIFETEKEAYEYEQKLVNNKTLKDPLCLNNCPGGYLSLQDIRKLHLYKKKSKKTFKEKKEEAKKLGIDYGVTSKIALKIAEDKRQKGLFDKWSIEYKGENNPAFKLYEQELSRDVENICYLLQYTNIPIKIIWNDIFNKKSKLNNFIKYCQKRNLIGKKFEKIKNGKYWTVNKNINYKSQGEYYFNIDDIEKRYDCILFIPELFNYIKHLKEFFNNEQSDAQIYNNQWELFCARDYFIEIGLLINPKEKLVKTKRSDGIYRTTKKTIYDWNVVNIKYIIDKELNIYGIDENGRPFQKSKLELSRT